MTTTLQNNASPTPKSTAERTTYIPGLDGLRALSVLVVIFGHAGIDKSPASLGVTVFFFISGYLITGLLLREERRTSTINIGAFYGRRFFRLMPELAAYATIALFISQFLDERPRIIDVSGALLYFTNYLNYFNPTSSETIFRFGHFWSLAVEEHFYLSWPIIVFFCRGTFRRVLVACALMLIIPAVIRFVHLTSGIGVEYVRFASEARFDSIAYGSLLASLSHFRPAWIKRIAAGDLWILLVGTALTGVSTFGGVIGFEGTAHEILVYCGQGVGLFLIFTYLYGSSQSTWLLRILELSPLKFYGKISYGVYIWHFFAVYAFARSMGYSTPYEQPLTWQILCGTVGVLASGLLGWLSWKFALRPFDSFRKRFGAHSTMNHAVP